MEPQQARLAFASFLTLCAFIVFNALFLQKDVGFSHYTGSGTQRAQAAGGAGMSAPGEAQDTKNLNILHAISRELSAQNYFPGRLANGRGRKVDAMLMGAIMAYQHDHHLPITGKPTDELLKNILFGVGVRPGSDDQQSSLSLHPHQLTAEIQGTLSALGLYDGKIDGLLHMASKRALRRFESQRGLPVSGRVSGLLVQELMRDTGMEFSDLR